MVMPQIFVADADRHHGDGCRVVHQPVPRHDSGRFSNGLIIVHEDNAEVGPMIPRDMGRRPQSLFAGGKCVEKYYDIPQAHAPLSARRRSRGNLRDKSAARAGHAAIRPGERNLGPREAWLTWSVQVQRSSGKRTTRAITCGIDLDQ
jgi:hypothetical protein